MEIIIAVDAEDEEEEKLQYSNNNNMIGYYCEHNLTLVVILVRLEPSPELRVGGRVPAAAAVHVGHTGVRGAGRKRA